MAATTNKEAGAGRLAGKVAWVTGSSRGIGRVVAGHLAALGAQVAIHGTSPTSTRAFGEADSLDAVAAEVAGQTGAEVLAVHGDLTREDTVKDLCAQIRDRFGAIHILVNNAGGDIGTQGTTGERAGKPASNDALGISLADIRTVLDRNLLTCILPCREVAPEMAERGRGWIVNVGSVAGLLGRPSEVIYGCAKAAVHHYTRALAAQLRPANVNVNAIAPGEIVTPRFLASRTPQAERQVEGGNLTRYGWPAEIARTVEFLVTDDSSYISGQVLRVDGGAQLWPA
ncbi:MAG: SDR family oxidoreductase [Spirochaetaceae bacterium]|nr:SDR family oxidoreductase [Spirochaetaceae bacterium]